MTKRLAAALAAALLLPAAAGAQTMEFGCPEPGTTFTYDSGVKVTAKGREGNDCLMEIVGGKPYKLRALLFDNPAPDGRDMTTFIDTLKPERLWPLEIGRKIEARFTGGGRTWNYTMSVAKQEKRTGPGGALADVWLVEMIEQADKGGRSLSRWWISPKDKFAIAFDFTNGEGKATRARVTEVKH
ncbi:MAG: hypothetical protein LCH95_17040 [Proteobacteria bacterium]|nr:hypothetical protein [Pseudomonadota bacterium]